MNSKYQTFSDYSLNIYETLPDQLNIKSKPPVEQQSTLNQEDQRKYAFYYIHTLKDAGNVQFRREMTIYQRCQTRKPKSFAFINREMYVFNREVEYNTNGEPKSAGPLYLAFAGNKYNLPNYADYIDRNGIYKDKIYDISRNGKLLITEVLDDCEKVVAIIPQNTLFWIDDEKHEINVFEIKNSEDYLQNNRRIKGKITNPNFWKNRGKCNTETKNKIVLMFED